MALTILLFVTLFGILNYKFPEKEIFEEFIVAGAIIIAAFVGILPIRFPKKEPTEEKNGGSDASPEVTQTAAEVVKYCLAAPDPQTVFGYTFKGRRISARGWTGTAPDHPDFKDGAYQLYVTECESGQIILAPIKVMDGIWLGKKLILTGTLESLRSESDETGNVYHVIVLFDVRIVQAE